MHPFLSQQRVSQRVCRPSPRGSRGGCRALLLLALLAGCGDVHFIPSPFTPQDVELVYSAQEHITVMRWRVSATDLTQTRFELLDPASGGYSAIDFSQSVYTGGLEPCGDGFGTCGQYVVRGQYSVPRSAHPIQAVHDVYGVLPGVIPMFRTVDPTLSLASFFHAHNDMVYVNITDPVAADGPYKYPRAYERTMWPTTGLCVSEVPPDDVSFSPLDATGGFPPPLPLTDNGRYCVATRPIPTDGGDATMVQVRIETLPELVSGTQIFDPPVERSPIVYQIVLDLEIPVPDRCADVIQKIENLTDRYMVGGSAAVKKLPTINLAANGSSQCAQTNDRTVAAAQVADQVKQAIASLDGVHQQYHFMYFNNLDAPLPTPLVTSLQSLFDALARSPTGYQLGTYSWIFNPGAAYVTTSSILHWWAYWPWKTADDMFAMMLADYGRRSLPYTTQQHDPYEPVPLLSDADVATYENDLVKICTASPGVQPVSTNPVAQPIVTPSWPISSADPPSYWVTLNQQIVVAAGQFVEQSAIVNYQICTRYCTGHGFVDTTGYGQRSWADTYACASKEN